MTFLPVDENELICCLGIFQGKTLFVDTPYLCNSTFLLLKGSTQACVCHREFQWVETIWSWVTQWGIHRLLYTLLFVHETGFKL